MGTLCRLTNHRCGLCSWRSDLRYLETLALCWIIMSFTFNHSTTHCCYCHPKTSWFTHVSFPWAPSFSSSFPCQTCLIVFLFWAHFSFRAFIASLFGSCALLIGGNQSSVSPHFPYFIEVSFQLCLYLRLFSPSNILFFTKFLSCLIFLGGPGSSLRNLSCYLISFSVSLFY